MTKALVTYFSATGVTKGVAEKLAGAIGADLFEIEPAQKYTAADLDWTDRRSRSTLEMRDGNCRPPIAKKTDVSPYDVVFVGFPVWWYREPSVIDTFIEQYDFAGKTIVPFATSGGSGPGKTTENLSALAPGATVKEGKRFASTVSAADLKKWAEIFF